MTRNILNETEMMKQLQEKSQCLMLTEDFFIIIFITDCWLVLDHFFTTRFIDHKSKSFEEKDLERNVAKMGECIFIFAHFISNLVFVLKDK